MIAGALDRLRLVLGRPDPRTPEELERDLEDELSFHLHMLEREERDAGLDPDAARTAARDRFGDIDRIRAACRRVANEDRAMLQRVNAVLTIVLVLAVVGLGVQGYLAQRENARTLETISSALVELRGQPSTPASAETTRGGAGANRALQRRNAGYVRVTGSVDAEGSHPVPEGGVSVGSLVRDAGTSVARSWLQNVDLDYLVELRHKDEDGVVQSSVARWPVVANNSNYFPDDRRAVAGDEIIVGVEPLRPPPAISSAVCTNGSNLSTIPMGSLRLLESLYARALTTLELSAEARAQIESDLAKVRERLGELGVAAGDIAQPTAEEQVTAQPSSTPGVVYLDGDVERPGVYSRPSAGGITVKRLVAAAGGTANWSRSGSERLLSIQRRDPDTGETHEVWRGYWDGNGLNAEDDPALESNDLVHVALIPPTVVRVRGSDWIGAMSNGSPSLSYPSSEPRPLDRLVRDADVLDLGELLREPTTFRIHATVAPLGGGPPESVQEFTWMSDDPTPPDFNVPRGSEVWLSLESEEPPVLTLRTREVGFGVHSPSSPTARLDSFPVQKMLAYLGIIEGCLERDDLAPEDRTLFTSERDLIRRLVRGFSERCTPDVTLVKQSAAAHDSPGE